MDILKERDVARRSSESHRMTYYVFREKRQSAVNDMLEMRVGIALTADRESIRTCRQM